MQIDVHQLELLLQVLFMCLLSCFIFLLVTENKSLRMVFVLLFSVVNKSSLACFHCNDCGSAQWHFGLDRLSFNIIWCTGRGKLQSCQLRFSVQSLIAGPIFCNGLDIYCRYYSSSEKKIKSVFYTFDWTLFEFVSQNTWLINMLS